MTREEFLAKQREYTKKREKAHFDKVIREEKAYKKALSKLYKQTEEDISKTIESLYTRYALSDGIPIQEAKKKISKVDVESFEKKVKALVENKDMSSEANEALKKYNLKIRVSRLQMMKHEIRLETIGLADKEEKALTEKLYKTYESEVERQAGIMGFSKETRKNILNRADRVINGDFHSATFSDRIWANQQSLQAKLEQGLTRSLLRGENPKAWARDLRSSLHKTMGDTGKENALFNANRLAITETSRVMNEARLSSLQEMGYDSYIWVCEPSACHICAPHDGEVFKTKDAIIGGNMPPLHPFCKCSVAAYYEYDPDKDTTDFMEIQNYLTKEIGDVKNIRDTEDREVILEEFNLDIDIGKQKNHIYGTNEFKQRAKKYPPSYFKNTVKEVERVGKNKIGTGVVKLNPKNKKIAKEKLYIGDSLNGVVVNNLNGKEARTDRAVIRYHKDKGWHMYPDYPSKNGGSHEGSYK